jgi:hypothetical protein
MKIMAPLASSNMALVIWNQVSDSTSDTIKAKSESVHYQNG